jgi:hypothetical protein
MDAVVQGGTLVGGRKEAREPTRGWVFLFAEAFSFSIKRKSRNLCQTKQSLSKNLKQTQKETNISKKARETLFPDKFCSLTRIPFKRI